MRSPGAWTRRRGTRPVGSSELVNGPHFCSQCGAQLREGSVFCGACGWEVGYCEDSDIDAEELAMYGSSLAPLTEGYNRNASPLRLGLGLAGSAMLLLGAFVPVMGGPLGVSANLFGNGKSDGAVVVVLAAATLFLALINRYRLLWLTGLGAFGVIVFDFFTVRNRLASLEGIGQNLVRLEWGWAVLLIGAGLVIAAAAVVRRPNQTAVEDE